MRRRGGFRGDLLQRYASTPFRAVFLFSSQDEHFRSVIERYWNDWSEESADTLDFYDYTIRSESPSDYSYSQRKIESLRPVPSADLRRIQAAGLPCMLLWSDADSLVIPFRDVAQDRHKSVERFRDVLSLISSGRIDELKMRFDPMVRALVTSVADIFISYSHADRETTERLDTALRREGFSVWFDASLRAGDRFDLQIEHFQRHACATVVLWTYAAIESKWVRAEALAAHTTQRLAQATVQVTESNLPIPFNAVHAENLTHWPMIPDGFTRLVAALRRFCPASQC
ncbi:MAG: toll/interleukin-1 receptor domain-containing protein [Hyphomonadaceae bacterium]|nr:toll/interleukin-1 receptor domain-containing protein [Hyphomonadaceae bacterium]